MGATLGDGSRGHGIGPGLFARLGDAGPAAEEPAAEEPAAEEPAAEEPAAEEPIASVFPALGETAADAEAAASERYRVRHTAARVAARHAQAAVEMEGRLEAREEAQAGEAAATLPAAEAVAGLAEAEAPGPSPAPSPDSSPSPSNATGTGSKGNKTSGEYDDGGGGGGGGDSGSLMDLLRSMMEAAEDTREELHAPHPVLSATNQVLLDRLAQPPSPTGEKEMGYFRYPHMRGDKVVFVSEGNIWVASQHGGPAARVSASYSAEALPKLSGDGSRVAFLAQSGDGYNPKP
jgi:hypothetical protein